MCPKTSFWSIFTLTNSGQDFRIISQFGVPIVHEQSEFRPHTTCGTNFPFFFFLVIPITFTAPRKLDAFLQFPQASRSFLQFQIQKILDNLFRTPGFMQVAWFLIMVSRSSDLHNPAHRASKLQLLRSLSPPDSHVSIFISPPSYHCNFEYSLCAWHLRIFSPQF